MMRPPGFTRAVLLAFLAAGSLYAQAEKPGVQIVTPSGLRYTDLKLGEGEEAREGRIVEVRYTGWLENGAKFDSSEGADPLTFRVGAGDVIKGLDEGVAGMRVGGKRRLRIPPELGFGKQGGGGVIPPNAILIYEIELAVVR